MKAEGEEQLVGYIHKDAIWAHLGGAAAWARVQANADADHSVPVYARPAPAAAAGVPPGYVLVPRKLAWEILGLLSQECAPCAEPECRISDNPEALITQCRQALYPLLAASGAPAPTDEFRPDWNSYEQGRKDARAEVAEDIPSASEWLRLRQPEQFREWASGNAKPSTVDWIAGWTACRSLLASGAPAGAPQQGVRDE